jgi:hypothetical protein
MPYIVLLDPNNDGKHIIITGFVERKEADIYMERWEARHPEGRADVEVVELHSSWKVAEANEI